MTIGAGSPLVTFAVFAFNQERYIGEAMAAALGQDYSPLEIIISDDCSTDRTFEIIQAAVADYRGPHQVRARRSPKNVGTFKHVLDVADESCGALLILAAGDDVSLPERSRLQVAAWRASGAKGLSTAWDTIAENGALLDEGVTPAAPGNLVWQYFQDKRDRHFLSGPGVAYETAFLRALPRTDLRIFHEDSVLTFIFHVLGLRSDVIESVTTKYRIHDQSYSNLDLRGDSLFAINRRERASAKYAKATEAYLSYLLDSFLPPLLAERPELRGEIDLEFMKKYRRHCAIGGHWIDASFSDRVRMLFRSDDLAEARMLVPRIAGLRTLTVIKAMKARLSLKTLA